MKFISVMKQILMFVFLFLFFQAVIEGEESIWYYCLDGVWDPGLNLHFFASSIVSISALIITRIFLHRILFLVGRIVNARGETICHLLDSMANYVLFTAGVFICLANLGVSATTLSLTGGIAGVVFGIGAQNVVNDILSGILMVFEGVVQVGELVFFNDKINVVLSVGLRTTKIIWYGETTVIRNNDFKNYKLRPGNQRTRVKVLLRIGLDVSVRHVEEVLQRELPGIHETLCSIDSSVRGPYYAGVDRIEESWVSLYIRCFCLGRYNIEISRRLQRELKLMCERNGIRIPVQQIEINQSGDREKLS